LSCARSRTIGWAADVATAAGAVLDPGVVFIIPSFRAGNPVLQGGEEARPFFDCECTQQ